MSSSVTHQIPHLTRARVVDGNLEITHGSPAGHGYATLTLCVWDVPAERIAIAAAALDGDMAEVRTLLAKVETKP